MLQSLLADPQKPRPGEPPPRFCNNLRYTRGGIEAIDHMERPSGN
jgi:hypothetical protein